MIRVSTVLFAATCLLIARPGEAASHYAERPEVQAFAADVAERNGFAADTLLALFEHARYEPKVIQYIQPLSSPGVRSWRSYRSRFIEPKRLRAGIAFWQQHAATLARAEASYGVPAEIVASIIGIETIYGRNTGKFQTFSALTTLAFDYPPRAVLFRRELEALLLLARDEHRSVLTYKGSYAGALGLPQFLPSSTRNWAVDFNGDQTVDLNNADDAIGSVARFLAEHGWEKGGPIMAPANADEASAAPLLAEGIRPQRLPSALRALGVNMPADVAEQAAALIDLVTPDAPTEYRLGYQNFFVITRYNRSSFYATSVYEFAQALKQARSGGDGFDMTKQ